MKSLLFLCAVLSFLLVLHYALFRSIIHFFNIRHPVAVILLYAAMVLLTFAFASAFFLLHWRESPWTIGYYRFAAVWTGFFIQLLMAVAVAWAVIGVARLAGHPLKPGALAAILLAAAIGYGIYGIWNAFHPRVRDLAVTLQDLPKSWENRTIVQLSDVHLGHLHGRKFADRLVDRINALAPDLIVITGDLFDGMGGPFESFIPILNRLRANRGIYFVTGNHEHYIGIDRALSLLKKIRLRVLDNECIEIDGLEIIGVSYPGIGSLADIANLPGKKNPRHARLLLFHTPTNMQANGGDFMDRQFSTYWRPDTTFALNRKTGADLQLSGHTHHGQIFPFNFITRLLYGGHDFGLTRAGDLRIYTTCGTGSWGPPMRTGNLPEIVKITLFSGSGLAAEPD